MRREIDATREAPWGGVYGQPVAREGEAVSFGVAEGFVRPLKPGNAGGEKGPPVQGERNTWRRTRRLD